MIGRLLMLRTISFTTFLLLESPMAVIVPSTVDITVARIAIVRDTYTALMIEPSEISLAYHLSEKPVILVRLLEELNENTIMTTIGR